MMTKEEIIKKAQTDGYSVDFTQADDCLYCSATDTSYYITNFENIGEYPFEENGKQKTLRTVESTEYQLAGYYIV